MSIKKNLKRSVSMILVFVILIITNVSAAQTSEQQQIAILVKVAENEIKNNGEISDSTTNKLQNKLQKLGIVTGSYSGTHTIEYTDESVYYPNGYGQTHNLGAGWSYRVDRPTSNAGDSKPHVHVDGKDGIHVSENVDGTSSHGTTLNDLRIPRKVRDKVRNSPDYKKGKKDLKKMQQAKHQIQQQHLDLTKYKDLVLAAAIFVACVGVAFFAPEALPAIIAAI